MAFVPRDCHEEVLPTASLETDPRNLLIIMPDEHRPLFSNASGHRLVDTPLEDRPADNGDPQAAARRPLIR